MFKLILILCLILPLKLLGQNGRYFIDSVEGRGRTEGHVTVTPIAVTVVLDSLEFKLPIERQERLDNVRTIMFLEGCLNNVSFRGAAILADYGRRGRKHNLSLVIELRTKQGYSFQRMALFYYE